MRCGLGTGVQTCALPILSDIVEAPVVTDLAIARDGRRALYVIRHAELATNAKRSRLHRVDLATGADQELRTSPWFSRLQAIPGSDDWSVLAELGEGGQVYRVDGTGRFTPILINHVTGRAGAGEEGDGHCGVRARDGDAAESARLAGKQKTRDHRGA